MGECLAATKSNAVQITKAVKDLKDKDESRQRSMTFHRNLDSVLSKCMVDKMAKPGLSHHVRAKVHEKLNTRGVIALLAGAGQKSARVTNSP